MKILITYYSKTGNTEEMAEEVRSGSEESGADVELKSVEETELEDLKEADGIIIGSPTHFGLLSTPVKELLDESIKIRGDLEGKVGAAFSSSNHRAGGRESTMLSILHAMLVHGMVVCGDPLSTGGHFGPAATGSPDEQARDECRGLGERVARLAKRLKGE